MHANEFRINCGTTGKWGIKVKIIAFYGIISSVWNINALRWNKYFNLAIVEIYDGCVIGTSL